MKFKNERLDRLTRHPLLTPALLALAAVCLGVLALWFAAVDNRNVLFLSYLTHPLILLLNILPPLLLALVLYFLIGRAGCAFVLTSAVTLGFAFANYYKLTFRNDPVIFEDLTLLREAGNMAGQYPLFLSKSMLAALLLVGLGWLFLHFFARARTPVRPRLLCAAAAVLLGVSLWWLYTDPDIYISGTENNAHINIYSATELYLSKGFFYPFLYSTRYYSNQAPAGYSEQAALDLLAPYEEGVIPQGKKVDLLAIQLEAFNDFTRLGATGINPEVYAAYHALEAESVTGNLVTNIFAGGTVNTERTVLTGLPYLPSLRVSTNAYPWYLKEQGYTTVFSHPSHGWFYNRENINRSLGFEQGLYLENRYGSMTDNEVGYDPLYLPDLLTLYGEHTAAGGGPYFSFGVTYQGHGPYGGDVAWMGEGWVEEGRFSKENEILLNNYFGSVKNTGELLSAMVDELRESTRPVVLVLFGDHNPGLGEGTLLYDALGVDLDFSTPKGFYNYYSTRYLIWANDAAKAALGNDFQGVGPDISPNYLMNEVFSLCSWSGPAYMQATQVMMERLSVINTDSGLWVEDGVLKQELSEAGTELYRDFKYLQYYWQKRFQY